MAMLDLKNPRCSDMFGENKKYIITFHFDEKNEEVAKKLFRSFYKDEEFLPNMYVDGIYGSIDNAVAEYAINEPKFDFAFMINKLRLSKADENIKYVKTLSEDELALLNQGEDYTYNVFRDWVRETDAIVEEYFNHVGYIDKEKGFIYHDDYNDSKEFVDVINTVLSDRLDILYNACKVWNPNSYDLNISSLTNDCRRFDDYFSNYYNDCIEHFNGTYEFRYKQSKNGDEFISI